MAMNPTTGVDYDVDRFAVWQESEQRYIHLNARWPRLDGGPIEGGNPDFRYYKRVNTDRPDVDHRYTVSSVFAKVNANPSPPEGHPSGEYKAVHTAIKLPVEDLKAQVDTEFQKQVRQQFPEVANPALLVRAAGALARQQDGATLTPAQEAMLTAVKGNEDAITQMESRRLELYAAIDADDDYDIEAGWVTA